MGEAPSRAQGLVSPLVYPEGRVCADTRTIIWQDLYPELDADAGARYRLTLRETARRDAPPLVTEIDPRRYFGVYYAYSLSAPLSAGNWELTIDRIIGGEPVTTRHYHYLRYPVKREFTVDPGLSSRLCALPPDYLIRSLQLDRANTYTNGYNALFFTGSSILSFGVGVLFYSVINFGIVSTIIYTISFISAGTGFTAAGYYGWRYRANRVKLEKMVEIGTSVSLNGAIIDERILTALELRY
jgi:hypothetical protein